jgi:Phage integrase family
MTLHDLRHFFASGLIASGCDVVTVQRAMGHRKATTTFGTYAHLWPTAEDKTRAGAASMMLQVIDPGVGKCGQARCLSRLTCGFALYYTMKRNSTTSPSAMT